MSAQAKNRLQPENFYPLSLSLKGREVIVFGGHLAAFEELLRLLEAGACATVVAAAFVSEIQELHVTYGSRLELVRVNEAKYLENCQDLTRFALVFALSANHEANEKAAAIATSSKVPFYVVGSSSTSDRSFVPVTIFKRGHIKISVSSDGICPPLETALMQRIEEILINDFDRYSLFLESVREQQSSDGDLQKWHDMIESEGLASALSRNNFEEALSIIERLQNNTSDIEDNNEGAV